MNRCASPGPQAQRRLLGPLYRGATVVADAIAGLAPFGVKVTLVYPGYFRTDFLKAASLVRARSDLAAKGNVRGGACFLYPARQGGVAGG